MEQPDSDFLQELEQLRQTEILALLDDLRKENLTLKLHLESVVATAAKNEKIWRHFIEIERILFRTLQLEQLVEELLHEIKERFQLDEIVLFINHPEILERFFPDVSLESEPIAENTWILPLPVEDAQALFGEGPAPFLLSSENLDRFRDFLPGGASRLGSGVIVPLHFHQMLFGCLFLGSKDAERYRHGDGTDLLQQLGSKIALCLDNCLIYERVKDIAVQDRWTGLLSFFQIHTILEREFRKACRQEAPLSLILMDLDFFQQAEEQSDIGTEVLKHVAGLLREIFTENDAFIGRYGSNEFVAVLPEAAGWEAEKIATYLSQLIRKSPCRYENAAILIHPTMAAVELEDSMKHPEDMLDTAYLKLCQLKMSRSRSTD
jgi:diguanylate cyclase (GGDEF)-like protein